MITFAARVAIAATALVLLGACSDDGTTTSDDGTTTLAKGAVRFVGSADLGGQTMDITAVEQDDQVTGEARFSFGLVLDLQCADTDTDGLVLLGGEATAEVGDAAAVGDRVAVIIREGDPDSALVWYELPLPEGEVAAGSCREFLDSIPQDQITGDNSLADVAEGDDIETG
jgi:hypothetical protein